jgi:hypothetical protein
MRPACDVAVPGSRSWFVYYQVHCNDEEHVVAAVQQQQQQLQQRHAGLSAALMRRPERVDERITLMEIYTTGAPSGDDPALLRDIESAQMAVLQGRLHGVRHVEAFLPCA